MKTQMIIPIFISHMGCRNDCIFCNQHHINGVSEMPSIQSVEQIIQDYLKNARVENVGIAFYGGSFTGLELEVQKLFLELALKYKRLGSIKHIRLSTRPDYINSSIVEMLKSYSVDLVELGVQSFDDTVLDLSYRGHRKDAIYNAVNCLKNYGVAYGIQLMFGLPGDNRERFFFSVSEAIALRPETVRIYPTLVLEDTVLAQQYRDGFYIPPTLEEAIGVVKKAYKAFNQNKIHVIRVGLQATDLIDFHKSVVAGPYHPAFKDLIMDAIFYDAMENIFKTNTYNKDITKAVFTVHPKSVSHIRGQRKNNQIKLKKNFGFEITKIIQDQNLLENQILLTHDHGVTEIFL